MDHAEEVRILENILATLENKHIPMGEGEFRRAVSTYTSVDLFQRELECLFRNYPIIVGHSSQVQNPGDYITHDLSGIPIVILRTKSGKLNAFVNVCRHRGARLVPEACGSDKKAFVCPYHAWTYDTDGQLINIPIPEGFPSLDRNQFHLVPIPAESKYGFVWVKFTPYSNLAELDSHIGLMAADLKGFSADTPFLYKTEVLTKSFNWKIGLEIFLELYHFKTLHKNSSFPIFYDTVGIYDRRYPHWRVITPKKRITKLAYVDRSNWRLRPEVTMGYYIFPNTFMFVEHRLISVMTVFPNGIGQTILSFMYLAASRATDERFAKVIDLNIEMMWTAAAEDFMIGESVQVGLTSGANEYMNFGRYEKGLDDFHSTIEDALKVSTSALTRRP
jgi:nitrite reductase/ring-hydroxylating ferredoxin subunit